jgi:acetyl/propionyl-CoA carboxylase alpha subunit
LDFDPPIEQWTDEQLDDALAYYNEHLRDFRSAFGDDLIFNEPILVAIRHIETEILERTLLGKS